jgi:hypothetical protein
MGWLLPVAKPQRSWLVALDVARRKVAPRHSDRLRNGKVPAGRAGVPPLQNARIVAIMPSWPPNWLFIWGIPDRLGLIAADDAKKLQFQMNVFWLRAAKVVPKGGPRRDT